MQPFPTAFIHKIFGPTSIGIKKAWAQQELS